MEIMQKQDLLGLTVEQAKTLAEERGYRTRVRNLEGQPMCGTCDMNRTRWNLTIEDGKVTDAYLG